MTKIIIHEDDEAMRLVYPVAAQSDVSGDMSEARTASEKNKSKTGVGWDDIHLIQPPKVNFLDMGVRVNECKNLLTNILPKVTIFQIGEAPGNPFYYRDEDPICYGFDERLFLKFEISGDLVKDIWYEAFSAEGRKLRALRTAFEAIDSLVPSIFADYWMKVTRSLSDKERLSQYFSDLAKHNE